MLFAALLSSLALLSPALAVSINNTLYIITNSERPSLSRPGLSSIGWQRAQDCIPPVRPSSSASHLNHHSDSLTFDLFIPSRIQLFADLNLGLILVCKPNIKTGACLPRTPPPRRSPRLSGSCRTFTAARGRRRTTTASAMRCASTLRTARSLFWLFGCVLILNLVNVGRD
jgi:hypothetical protein